MNLERTGRYFFQCKIPSCGASLVVTKRKDSAVGELMLIPLILFILTNIIDSIDELREPLVEGELTVYGKAESVPTPNAPKKVKKKGYVSKKLERVKKGWAESKNHVRETRRDVMGFLSSLTGYTDPDSSDSDTGTVQRPTSSTRSGKQAAKNSIETAPSKRSLGAETPSGTGPKIPAGRFPSKPKPAQSGSGTPTTRNPSHSIKPSSSMQSANATGTGSQTLRTKQKGKQPATNNTSRLPCRFCTSSFPPDDAGSDALFQHTQTHHATNQPAKHHSKNPPKVPPTAQEDANTDARSSHEDLDDLFPQCRMCPRTFPSDAQRVQHQEEVHPGETERFPQCRVCLASFPHATARAGHERKAHREWYDKLRGLG